MKFSEILFSKCFPTKENATKKLFWHFWAFFGKKSQNCLKMKKIAKIFKPFD